VAVAALSVLLAVYGFGVLGMRPMAALRATDTDVVIVDFHSHTEASHDGRAGYDIWMRRWFSEGAGFDITYVTDHWRQSTGIDPIPVAIDAMADNPMRAGDGLSILPGRELVFREQHVIVLGMAHPVLGVPPEAPWPVMIQTIPNDLSRVPIPDADGRRGVHAIELMDGDPRGFRQSVEERDRILAIADSMDLVPIAASNHHGWGAASVAWTLMRIPGWRDRTPEDVGRRIEEVLRSGGAAAVAGGGVRVVERPRLSGGTIGESAFSAVTTLPRFAWHLFTGLTFAERVVWLLWATAALAAAGWVRGRSPTEAPAP
jgi:hypothetical protein